MKELNKNELEIVAGGKNDQVSQTLTQVQSSLKDLASSNNNSSNNLLLPMVMMMAFNRPQQTVVAAAPAASPIINIRARFRRW